MVFQCLLVYHDSHFIVIIYSLSLFLLFTTICILFLNIFGQLNARLDRMKAPMRRPRAILVVSCCVSLMLWQLAIFVPAKVHQTLQSEQCFGILLATLLCSMMFYCCVLSFMFLTYLYVKFHMNLRKIKLWWLYVTAYVLPICCIVVVLSLSYIECKQFSICLLNSEIFKYLLVVLQLIFFLMILAVISYVFYTRVQQWRRLQFSYKKMMFQLRTSQKLTNGLLLTFLLALFIIISISMILSTERKDSLTYTHAVFHCLLGAFFFVFEFLLYDKDFKTPFHFQRQKKAARLHCFKNSFVFTENKKKHSPKLLVMDQTEV